MSGILERWLSNGGDREDATPLDPRGRRVAVYLQGMSVREWCVVEKGFAVPMPGKRELCLLVCYDDKGAIEQVDLYSHRHRSPGIASMTSEYFWNRDWEFRPAVEWKIPK